MKLLFGGRVITRDKENPFYENGGVLMDGDNIVQVGQAAEMLEQYPNAERLDAHGGIIMPGLINIHNHLRGVFARGLDFPAPQGKNFLSVLDGRWWAQDRKMKLADTAASAACAFIDCIENGVTTVFEQLTSYGEVPGSLISVAASAKELGLRLCLCHEISDREGEKKMRQAVKENAELIALARSDESDLLASTMGLHAQFTLSDASLDYIASKTPSGSGYTIHVAEGALDVTESLNKHGIRPVFRLYDFGMIGRGTICCDCTHISEREMDILKNSDAMISHCPQSNMLNAVGCPPVLKMLEKGMLVGLGTDGYTADMLESLKAAALLHTSEHCDLTASERLPALLFDNNPAIASRFFSRPLGVLKPGAHADVIVMDYDPYTPLTSENVNNHLLRSVCGLKTKTTIIAGEPRMINRELLGIDKREVVVKAEEAAAALQKRLMAKK